MFTNLLILVFLGLMVYWWGLVRGWFEAWLHLMITVVAGSLSFALWEPTVLYLLIRWMPSFAWGVGLIAPFVLLMVVLRKVSDRLVRASPRTFWAAEVVVGGVLGLASGVLTSGLTLIGIGFLALPGSLGGYQPLVVEPSGRVVANENGQLWVPVDDWAWGAWSRLSSGAFGGPHDMNHYQPELPSQAALFRMRSDPHGSVTAVPESVEVMRVLASKKSLLGVNQSIIRRLDLRGQPVGKRLVVIETRWKIVAGDVTYDSDGILRVPPTQIRLITGQRNRGGVFTRLKPPVGWTYVGDRPEQRLFSVFDSDRDTAFSYVHGAVIGWVFIIRNDEEPTHLVARHLRLHLPPLSEDPSVFAAALGRLNPRDSPDSHPLSVGDADQASQPLQMEISDLLPDAIGVNQIGLLEIRDNLLISGHGDTVFPPQLPPAERVSRIWVPPHQSAVRVKVNFAQARSLLGVSHSGLEGEGEVALVDQGGGRWLSAGYVWARQDRECRISIDRSDPIHRMDQLPVAQMQAGEDLYLYFLVHRGTRITALQAGRRSVGGLDLLIPE